MPEKAPEPAVAGSRRPGLDFIGNFPMRKSDADKKLDPKKQAQGPVFPRGDYRISCRSHGLGMVLLEEFKAAYISKHVQDTVKLEKIIALPQLPTELNQNSGPILYGRPKSLPQTSVSKHLEDALLANKVDVVVLNMKDVPYDLPSGIVLASTLKREDSRDALVTRNTIGAIQELPRGAKVAASSRRRVMQIKALRPDLEIVHITGEVPERLQKMENENLDAVLVAWASLRRLNISPRYYVALTPDQVVPAATQGIAGILCRADDKDLLAKLRYIEDSEASWAARCERAFVQKLGGTRDVPVGVFAHRKGTQDPWILDSVIGDARSGEVLKHREIGTSRCKPESLADKAFMGILGKGARKFLPFT